MKKEKTNAINETAKNIVRTEVEYALSDLTNQIVGTTIENVKKNLFSGQFRPRLTRLKKRR